jgi:hypothetical protein
MQLQNRHTVIPRCDTGGFREKLVSAFKGDSTLDWAQSWIPRWTGFRQFKEQRLGSVIDSIMWLAPGGEIRCRFIDGYGMRMSHIALIIVLTVIITADKRGRPSVVIAGGYLMVHIDTCPDKCDILCINIYAHDT